MYICFICGLDTKNLKNCVFLNLEPYLRDTHDAPRVKGHRKLILHQVDTFLKLCRVIYLQLNCRSKLKPVNMYIVKGSIHGSSTGELLKGSHRYFSLNNGL